MVPSVVIVYVVFCRKLNNTSYSVSIFISINKQSNRSISTAFHLVRICAQREEPEPASCPPSLRDIIIQSELTTVTMSRVSHKLLRITGRGHSRLQTKVEVSDSRMLSEDWGQ